jgi:transcription elongation GreA/GreB family factor
MLSSHAKRLHDDLRRARGLDPTGIDASAVRVGTRVTLEPVGNGAERRTLVLLGPWDSDPATGILSYLAPAVQPLLGKRPGERVRFGDADYVVGSIEVWRRD